MESTRQCKKCGQIKSIEEFQKAWTKQGIYYRHTCVSCYNKKANEYYSKADQQTKEKRRQAERDWAAKNGSWVRPGLKIEKVWTEKEYQYNVRQARKLKKRKIYFEFCKFNPDEMVSDAYVRMIEKGLQYSRWQFFLLIWQAMAHEKYLQTKKTRSSWEFYLRRVNENKAIGRFLMKRWYIDQLAANKGIDVTGFTAEDYSKYREHLSNLRQGKVLTGEVVLTHTQAKFR